MASKLPSISKNYKTETMKDMNDPIEKQAFLKRTVSKSLLANKLGKLAQEARRNSLIVEADLLKKMVSFLESDSDSDQADLMRHYRLRKLRVI